MVKEFWGSFGFWYDFRDSCSVLWRRFLPPQNIPNHVKTPEHQLFQKSPTGHCCSSISTTSHHLAPR
jgi:hypothetical protein